MNKTIERFFIAIIFALLAAGVTMIAASALQVEKESKEQFTTNCATCHTEHQMVWQTGAHGQAATDPIFVEEWDRQGNPNACLACHTTGFDVETGTYQAEGVTCEACHGPASSEHPKSPMPVNRSPELCSNCHTDTRFGWNEYQGSTHYQDGIDCATCHDPHSTTLKNIDGLDTSDGSVLCINCHKEYSLGFAETSHHQEGVSCADCHIVDSDIENRPAHSIPDHSFAANISTCNNCHTDEMHDPADAAHADENQPMQLASLSPEPDPVSPIGFSLMAGLIGLAGGMVLAPWLEKWLHRQIKIKVEDDNEQEEH